MKKLFLFSLLIFYITANTFSQSVGIGTTTPNVSAQLDVTSTTKGLLAPRLTLAQRNAIVSPTNGLLIYQTDVTPGFYYYTGATWQQLSPGSGTNYWTANGTNIYNNNSANVGIGITTPAYKLSVDGSIGMYAAGDFKGTISSLDNNLLINATRMASLFGSPDHLIMQLTTGSGLNQIRAGNVGINIDTPLQKLHVGGNAALESSAATLYFRNSTGNIGFVDINSDDCRVGTASTNTTGSFIIRTGNTNRFWIANDGRISVGTTYKVTNGFMMNVQGRVICEEVKVQLASNWPDYVFKKDYRLKSFEDLRRYIGNNDHLPGIPAAAEVERDGLTLGDMQKRMMEKIEELTLYVLQLEEQNKKQNRQIALLQEKIKK